MTRFHTEPQYLIELEAHDGTVYGFATGRGFAPVDPDAALYRGQYDGRVSADTRLVVRRETDGAGSSSGAAGQSFGAITLNNADGGLDVLGEKGFDGRALRILFAPAGARSMAECEPVYRGTVTELQVQRLTVTIQPRDRLEELNAPVGSTVDAAEWPDADGERLPVVAGAAVSVPLFWLDRVLLIAAVHDGAATVSGVYDLGVALTAGAAYADIAELKSTAPSGGQYRVLSTPEGTFVRLGSRPQDHDKIAADVATATTDGPSMLQALAPRSGTFKERLNLIVNSARTDLWPNQTGAGSEVEELAPVVVDDVSFTPTRFTSAGPNWHRYGPSVFNVTAGLEHRVLCYVKPGNGGKLLIDLRDTNAAGGPNSSRVRGSFGNLQNQDTAGPVTEITETDLPGGYKKITCKWVPNFTDICPASIGPYADVAGEYIDILGLHIEQASDLGRFNPTGSTAEPYFDDIGPWTFEALSRDWQVGGWWPGETSILDAVSEIAQSLGAVIFFDRLGRFSAARLTPEVGLGGFGIYGPQNRSPGSGARRATELDRVRLGKPAKEVSVGYAKSHAFYSDLGALWDTAPARAERISRDYARSVVQGAGVAEKHLLASSMRLDTILEDKAQAETVAEELRAAQGAWFHSVIISADEAAFQALDLGARVDIHESRWSGAAISAVVREIAHDLTAGTITLGVRE